MERPPLKPPDSEPPLGGKRTIVGGTPVKKPVGNYEQRESTNKESETNNGDKGKKKGNEKKPPGRGPEHVEGGVQ